MAAASKEMMLMMPPRTLGEKESIKPMSPKTMATTARMKPQNAPVPKLSRAATIAMMEGMRKCALLVSISIK
ncbi:MAG: hypothetical protein JWR19_4306 [Pedosphaera sp.]|nr:hypothetical protein [Pedosphaera sp.]